MHYLKLTALALSTALMQAAPADTNLSIKERVVLFKEQAKERLAPVMVLVSDSSQPAQERRLKYYQWLEERDWWTRHPKRWIVWVMTGSMPAKDPEGRISDAEYVQHYMAYKELCKGEPLSDKELIDVREEAMQLLDDYRQAKGIR